MKFVLCFAAFACVLACGHAQSPLLTCSTRQLESLAPVVQQCAMPLVRFVGRNVPSLVRGSNMDENINNLCSKTTGLIDCMKPVIVGSGCFAKDFNDVLAAVFDGGKNAVNYLCADNGNVAKELWKEGLMSCVDSITGPLQICGNIGSTVVRSFAVKGLYSGWKTDFCSVVDKRETCVKSALKKAPACSAKVSAIYAKFLDELNEFSPCTSNAV